jgi:hypothetical protein
LTDGKEQAQLNDLLHLGGGERKHGGCCAFGWSAIVIEIICYGLFGWRSLIGSFDVTCFSMAVPDWLFLCDPRRPKGVR